MKFECFFPIGIVEAAAKDGEKDQQITQQLPVVELYLPQGSGRGQNHAAKRHCKAEKARGIHLFF